MMLTRVALRMAINPSPEHRWRRVAVPVSAALFMSLCLIACSVLTLVEHEGQRGAARMAVISPTSSPNDLFVRFDADTWRDHRIEVLWLEPAGAGRHPALPPGMRRLPTPGQSVVSPELARMARRHPELAARYPDRIVLGEKGVRAGDELIVYRKPPAGRRIGGEDEAVRRESGRFVGAGPVARVARFDGSIALFEADEPVDQAPVWVRLVSVVGMLVIPGVLVLSVGIFSASRLRDRRFHLLQALGVSRRTLCRLAALEALVLATPGFVACAVVWLVVAPRLTFLPLVGRGIVGGDVALSWAALALVILGAVCLCGLLAAVRALPRRRPVSPRPVGTGPRLSRVAAAPLFLSALAFAAAALVSGGGTSDLRLIGMVLAVAGTPLVVPGVLRAAGIGLGRQPKVATSLAGRGMEWTPQASARPFLGLAGLVVLVLIGAGYVTLGRDLEAAPTRTSDDVAAVSVEWQDVTPADVDHLDEAISSGLVIPVSGAEEDDVRSRDKDGAHAGRGADDGGGHVAGEDITLGATCSELAAALGQPCDPRSDLMLPESTRQQLRDLLMEATHDRVGSIRLASRADLREAGSALVLSRSPLPRLDDAVRTAAFSTLPAPHVSSALDLRPRESPAVRWIVAGVLVAVVSLTAACLIGLVDRLLATRQRRLVLLNLGLASTQLTVLEVLGFVVPYAVSAGTGFVVGLMICWSMVGPQPGVPWAVVLAVLVALVVVGSLGALAVSTLGVRATLREAE